MPVETDPEQDEQQEELRGQMGFLDHLEELRKRIINSLIAVAIGLGVCWTFSDTLFNIVAKPIRATGASLIMFKPTEAFNVLLKLSVVAAIFVTAPFILAQVWLFISPGLYKHE